MLCVSSNEWAGALCSKRPDLPWTPDVTPDAEEQARMAAVCAQCPVLILCAQASLKQDGGFWAGIWMPWSITSSQRILEERRVARRALKRRALQSA
jgi:hypothetical protein